MPCFACRFSNAFALLRIRAKAEGKDTLENEIKKEKVVPPPQQPLPEQIPRQA